MPAGQSVQVQYVEMNKEDFVFMQFMFIHYEVAIFKPFWVLALGATSDRNAPSYEEDQ